MKQTKKGPAHIHDTRHLVPKFSLPFLNNNEIDILEKRSNTLHRIKYTRWRRRDSKRRVRDTGPQID